MKLGKVSNSQMIKEINQQKVLRLIYTEGPIARVDLAGKTGLTQQTITNIVNRLLSENLILETTPTSNGGRRRPIPLVINSRNMYAIGIELAIKYVRGTLMDFQNNSVKEVTEFVPRYENEEHPMEYIFKVIDQLLEHVPDQEGLKGIGFSIQGLVNSNKGTVIYSPGLRWRDFPLKKKLMDRYGLPIYLENDANLLAIVESLNGKLASSEQSIVFKFDYGIGSAMVINRQLLHGANYVAGELGHYKAFTGSDAIACHCGAKGCLTTFASISGLKRNAGFTLEEFSKKVRANDLETMELFEKIQGAIAKAIANVITLFNPEHILFTGRFMDKIGDLLIPLIKKEVLALIPDSCRNVKIIVLDETPDESRSAAGLVMNHFFNVPFNEFY
ncbi:ROK family transcriptional regulator [Lederbergia sp. NSJ-179]|uniref:ROK family transcriptional regulator n=1 Tax=Lederbergia sp. NSJ-179 TaxID=2931402 RepID=UPI001FD45B07|nr:ROK family transcriptional regulator [Lederbergia sp. NSJ-179]MCJ7842745.1 ROK family transcriptional regulator [Lederbergia sp. NSJ-179]